MSSGWRLLPHTCCIRPTKSCIRNNCEGEEIGRHHEVLRTVIVEKVRGERRRPHQLKEPPHEEPLAYPRRPWKVELVAEGRREDKVVHV